MSGRDGVGVRSRARDVLKCCGAGGWSLALAVFCAAAACACGAKDGSTMSHPPPVASNGLVVGALVVGPARAISEADSGPPPPDWSALVRDAQWDAAWRALDALPEADKDRPDIRYVRSRVALARADAAAALPLLDGLETTLPLLAADVERRRAEAKLVVGPFAEAGEWFAARATPSAQLEAARAFQKAGDARRVRVAVDRVLSNDKRTRSQEGEARALRIGVATSPDDIDKADARWLAVQGADLPVASDALALRAKIDPAQPLAADELVMRARVLSEAGRADDALHALDLALVARHADKLSRAERLHVRGMVLFHARGRGGEASRVLFDAAAAGGPTAAEDAFHAARALSRADRDEEAIVAYDDVPRRYPNSPWAEQAAYFVPYLRMIHGDWRECAHGFDGYLHAHPAGERAADARVSGALCKLLEGEAKAARAAFEQLVEDEPDPIVSARMANMAALAALRDGDRTHAVARWTDVARSRPLSWPALVARARLAEAGAPVPPPIDPSEAASPDAGALSVTIPPPADLLDRLGLDEDAEVALRERESTITSGAGPRAAEALCVAYGQLGRARRLYQIAQSLPSAFFALAPSARTRWAWDCAFPTPYADVVREVEATEKLPQGLLWAVMRQESAFDPEAVSPAKAVGLMQLLPETARPIAEELDLPHDDARLTSPSYAIRVGARVLRKLLDELHGNVPLALAAYNGGAETVARWATCAPGMQLDTFVEHIPYKETRDYVIRVVGNMARYGYLGAGDEGVPAVGLAL
jgi:soluble lytic murein transglycosylase